MKVFVYGTLKRGFHNSHLLTESRLVGSAVTVENFLMFGHGFPVILRGDGAPVAGEVYEVDAPTLANLDRLEGYSEGRKYNHYDRTLVKVRLGDELIDAFIYLGGKPYDDCDPEEIEEGMDRFLTDDNLLEWSYQQ